MSIYLQRVVLIVTGVRTVLIVIRVNTVTTLKTTYVHVSTINFLNILSYTFNTRLFTCFVYIAVDACQLSSHTL